MATAEQVYAEAAEARRSIHLSEAAERRQRLAALIPHRHSGGDYCTACGLPQTAVIHHWSTR